MSAHGTFLDCGCHISSSGGWTWCPTCAYGGPRNDTADQLRAAEAAIVALEDEVDTLRADVAALVPLAKCGLVVLDYFKARPAGVTLSASEELKQYLRTDPKLDAARAILDRVDQEAK